MDLRQIHVREIAALRVRRTWTGKLVLQLRRYTKRMGCPRHGETAPRWEDVGIGLWRDANGNDAIEVAEVTAALSPNGLLRPGGTYQFVRLLERQEL